MWYVLFNRVVLYRSFCLATRIWSGEHQSWRILSLFLNYWWFENRLPLEVRVKIPRNFNWVITFLALNSTAGLAHSVRSHHGLLLWLELFFIDFMHWSFWYWLIINYIFHIQTYHFWSYYFRSRLVSKSILRSANKCWQINLGVFVPKIIHTLLNTIKKLWKRLAWISWIFSSNLVVDELLPFVSWINSFHNKITLLIAFSGHSIHFNQSPTRT